MKQIANNLKRLRLQKKLTQEQAAEALGEGTAPIDIVLNEKKFPDIHPVKILPADASNQEKVEWKVTVLDADDGSNGYDGYDDEYGYANG